MSLSPPLGLRQYFLLPGLLFLVAAVIFETTDIDLAVASLFYDKSRGLWIHGDSPWSNDLLHEGGRSLVFLIGMAGIGILLLSPLIAPCRRWRRPAAYLVTSIALATGIVAGLKQITNVDCPWDLEGLGGDRPYMHIFANRPDHLPPGRCFPGGHSSGAFSLLSVFFIFRERFDRTARLALISALILGAAFALGQWARGAHFLSHSVWSAFLCWTIVLGLYLGPFRGRLWPVAEAPAGEQR